MSTLGQGCAARRGCPRRCIGLFGEVLSVVHGAGSVWKWGDGSGLQGVGPGGGAVRAVDLGEGRRHDRGLGVRALVVDGARQTALMGMQGQCGV